MPSSKEILEKKISIIIVSYNQDNYLEDTIISAISQDYSNKEVILIDGGSIDNSKDIIKKYSTDIDYWISEQDNGQSDAIIKGFEISTGDIITWINSDDILLPGVLDIVNNKSLQVKDPNGVYYGNSHTIDSEGNMQEKYKYGSFNYFISKNLGPGICQPGTFYSKSAYDSIGGINQSLGYGMDYDLFCNFLFSGFPFHYTGKYHSQFRKYPSQKGHSKKYLERCRVETVQLQNKYGLSNKSDVIKLLARSILFISRVLNGYYLTALLYRIKTRRSFAEFNTKYSA